MRLSTAFTGVAACAVFVAPPATAVTGQTTRRQLVENDARKAKMRPASTIESTCHPGTSNWFHMAVSKSMDACVGYVGTVPLYPPYFATSFCGGNNRGWFSGYRSSGYGPYYYTKFVQGTTYAHIPNTGPNGHLEILTVHISKYSGNDKCKFP